MSCRHPARHQALPASTKADTTTRRSHTLNMVKKAMDRCRERRVWSEQREERTSPVRKGVCATEAVSAAHFQSSPNRSRFPYSIAGSRAVMRHAEITIESAMDERQPQGTGCRHGREVRPGAANSRDPIARKQRPERGRRTYGSHAKPNSLHTLSYIIP